MLFRQTVFPPPISSTVLPPRCQSYPNFNPFFLSERRESGSRSIPFRDRERSRAGAAKCERRSRSVSLAAAAAFPVAWLLEGRDVGPRSVAAAAAGEGCWEAHRSRVASRAHLLSLFLSLARVIIIIPCRRSFLIYTGAECSLRAIGGGNHYTSLSSFIILAQAISLRPRITLSTSAGAFFPSRCGLHRGLRSRRTGSFRLADTSLQGWRLRCGMIGAERPTAAPCPCSLIS
jgi:hypothetical protein